MATIIRTAKTRYEVDGIQVPANGPSCLVVRQPSGRLRRLTRTEVGRPRFDAAFADFTRRKLAA